MLQASAMETASSKWHNQQIQRIQQQNNAALERANARFESRERPIAAIQVMIVMANVAVKGVR
jgi:hypothetical protein